MFLNSSFSLKIAVLSWHLNFCHLYIGGGGSVLRCSADDDYHIYILIYQLIMDSELSVRAKLEFVFLLNFNAILSITVLLFVGLESYQIK